VENHNQQLGLNQALVWKPWNMGMPTQRGIHCLWGITVWCLSYQPNCYRLNPFPSLLGILNNLRFGYNGLGWDGLILLGFTTCLLHKNILNGLSTPKISPNFSESCQNTSCIKLFKVSLKWWTAKTFFIFNPPNHFSIPFLIMFFQFPPKSLQGESILFNFLCLNS